MINLNSIFESVIQSLNQAISDSVAKALEPLEARIVALEAKTVAPVDTIAQMDLGYVCRRLASDTSLVEKLAHAVEIDVHHTALAHRLLTTDKLREEVVEKFVDKFDHGDVLRRLADEISARDVAREMDAAEVAGHISVSEVAAELDISEVARNIEASDIASEMDVSDVAAQLDIEEVGQNIDLSDHIGDKIEDVVREKFDALLKDVRIVMK